MQNSPLSFNPIISTLSTPVSRAFLFRESVTLARTSLENAITDQALAITGNNYAALREILALVLESSAFFGEFAPMSYVDRLVNSISSLSQKTVEDANAAYSIDPAASSLNEVLLCYPGIKALLSYRIAHQFSVLGLKLVARMWSELAHGEFGIDIHPSCSIGRRCFIDHGNGVVIGETAIIGDDVTIYHGVTIGALRICKSKDSPPNKQKVKRHPTIGNRVTLYAHATILGGETTIGNDSIIGCRAMVTHSIPDGSKVV